MRIVHKNSIYFAAPLFSAAEKQFNDELTQKLESLGFRVFLPQRDGMEFAKAQALPPHERSRRIFELDVRMVEESDIIIAVLDGRVPDEGVCVELAIASEYKRITKKQKWILGLKTDTRTLLQDADLNPMIAGGLDLVFSSVTDLLGHIEYELVLVE